MGAKKSDQGVVRTRDLHRARLRPSRIGYLSRVIPNLSFSIRAIKITENIGTQARKSHLQSEIENNVLENCQAKIFASKHTHIYNMLQLRSRAIKVNLIKHASSFTLLLKVSININLYGFVAPS